MNGSMRKKKEEKSAVFERNEKCSDNRKRQRGDESGSK